MDSKTTLKQLLKEDNLTGSDKGIIIIDGGTVFSVSPRYLEGGWGEILNAVAIKVGDRRYNIVRED